MSFMKVDKNTINVVEIYGKALAEHLDRYLVLGSDLISTDGEIKVSKSRWGIIEISSHNGFIIAPFFMKPPYHDVLTSFSAISQVRELEYAILNSIFTASSHSGYPETMLKSLNKLKQVRIN